MSKNYSDYPKAHAMKPYVPATLTPGQPAKVSRALLKQMEFHDAFKMVHGMMPGEALQKGFIVLTNDVPESPQGGQA